MNRINNKNKKLKKKKKTFRFGRFIGFLILIIIFVYGITLGVKVYKNGGGLQGFLSAILGHDEETLQNLDTIYVLAMGISEDLDSKLTDTIILCAYNPEHQTASMLSIPRDTFVGESKAKAKGSDKINSVYSESPQKMLDTVSKITGIDVKYYAVVNTKALIETVDIIGGVNFEVPINMDYDDKTQNLHIHLDKGMQKIDGEKAEQLLRFRHSNPDKNGTMTTYPSDYGNDDFGRMKTQRDFIIQTVKQTLQIKNVTKIKSLMTTVFNNMETNLTLDMLLPYAPYALEFNTDNIESLQLPGISDKLNNLWFFVQDEEETILMIEEMNNKLEGIEPVIEDGNTTYEGNTVNNEIKDSKNITNANKKNKNTNTNSVKKSSKATKVNNTTKK